MHHLFEFKHSQRIIALLALLLILFLAYKMMNKKSHEDNYFSMAAPVQVETVQVRDMPILITALAQLLPIDSANISSEVDGLINAIHFEEGDKVEQGELLIQLNDASQVAYLKQAQAQKDLAEIDYQRIKNLYARGASPKQELDKVEADLKVAEANVSLAEAELEKTLIKAPFSGRLGERNISVGQYVSSGHELISIVDKTVIKIQYAVPQQFLPEIEQGAQVTFTTSAFPQKAFTGQVDFISPTIDRSTRTLLVEAIFQNPHELLSPGLSGKIRQVLGVVENAISIPEEALLPTITGYEVYKVVEGQAYSTPVSIGSRIEGRVHIIEGLEPGDVLVTQGLHRLRDGAPVEVNTQERN